MPILETTYAAAVAAARTMLPLFGRGEGKLARGIRGRADVLARMEAWARTGRDPRRPLIWFHAPSVGEGMQAREVVQALRARRPDIQVAYTFFSPSAEGFAATVQADFADYLPLDVAGDVRRALDALRPGVLVFSKADVWPVLTREAEARGIRLALLSATLPAGSSRLRRPARALLGPAYRRLDVVGAIAGDDAARFAMLGVQPERVRVTGDARFDQVWRRAASVEREGPLLGALAADAPTLVAGSTWPADEARLIPAAAALRLAGVPLRLILAPHEPTPVHLSAAEAALDAAGLPHARLAEVQAGRVPPQVVVVDRVGVLGDLYALADVAYVGGGFGGAGLHSVLEPAVFGVPVAFGPRHANAREAAEMARTGAAFVVRDADELRERLGLLIGSPDARHIAGDTAREYVRAGLGAAARGADILAHFL
jgi:3-deoxy-D-manno-octulosonic-acid transferase